MHVILTTKEAAQFLRLSPRTLERHRQQGSGPKVIRQGRRVHYFKSDLNQWLNDNIAAE